VAGHKKHPSVRARMNRASTAAMLPADGPRRPVPRLPELAEVDWLPATRTWWRDLWRSPMSAEYHPATDRHMLYVLAVLMNDYFGASAPLMRLKLAAEIRLQVASFGLTPYARRRLEWQIAETEDRKDARARRAAPPAQPEDPRLSVVK
jgi:hypothetical protein